MSLYPNHKVRGVRQDWDMAAMDRPSTGKALRQRGVPDEWGDPIDAISWANFDGEIKIVVADYANGKRVELRNRKRDRQITFSTIPTLARATGDA